MRILRLVSALFFLAAFPSGLLAQRIPVNPRFGAVSDEEILMTSYEPDTSASVLILYRHHEVDASFSATGRPTRKETITERVKILKESGKQFPDTRILYRTNCSPREFVSDIKVSTYNMEGGKRTVDKLSRKMIFDEEVSETLRSVSFSAPNVRVGSVVEMSFTLTSPYVADIGTLELQLAHPVNWSEVTVSYADYFSFNRMERGGHPCEFTRDSRTETLMFDRGDRFSFTLNVDRYKAVDVPAIRKAPHCYCPAQYCLAVDYDLHSFVIPGVAFEDFSTSWDRVDEQIRDDLRHGEFFSKCRFADEVQAVASSTAEDLARIAAIRDLVAEKVKWNEQYNVIPRTAKALKAGSGDTADINAIAATALAAAGYAVEPVYIRTRNRGVLADYHVSRDAYNTVLLRVTNGEGRTFFMDAARKYTAPNVLPETYLVPRARVIPREGSGYWENLTSLSRNQLTRQVEMTVAPDGTLHGKSTTAGYNGYAVQLKSDRGDYDTEEEFISSIEQEEGIEVLSLQFTGADTWGPDARMEVEFEDQADAAGGLIYVKPFLQAFHAESDFRDPERKIPVDFPFAHRINYMARITIPEGYTVESLPQPIRMASEVAKSRVVMQCVYDGDRTVTLNYVFNMDAMVVPAEQYQDLRAYWEQLCGLYRSVIVLKKG